MDTKWNNMINKIREFIVKKWEYLIGILLIGIGSAMILGFIVFYYYYFSRNEMIVCGILENIFVGAGLVLILKKYFVETYGAWVPEEPSIYQEWMQEVSFWEKRLRSIAILPFLFSAFMVYRYDYEFFPLMLTVIIQYMVCLTYIKNFMNKKLDIFMEHLEEINRMKVEKALEIEKRSLEKVSRSDQLRMDLITNVSHDLKTPLTSMVGYLELIKKEELSDVVRDYVDVIVDKTDKLKEMIDSLFSLAKVSSGNVELHMETFQFNRLMEQIMADMKDKIDESELQFVTKLVDENTEIISDNMYCYRICQNLLENALKYSAKGTRVFVKTYVEKETNICLEMTNTAGYYMDFEKEDILEKFARGDKSRSTEGNGLGLAIVSSYAKALGGEFDIHIDCDQFKAHLKLPKQKL